MDGALAIVAIQKGRSLRFSPYLSDSPVTGLPYYSCSPTAFKPSPSIARLSIVL